MYEEEDFQAQKEKKFVQGLNKKKMSKFEMDELFLE